MEDQSSFLCHDVIGVVAQYRHGFSEWTQFRLVSKHFKAAMDEYNPFKYTKAQFKAGWKADTNWCFVEFSDPAAEETFATMGGGFNRNQKGSKKL